MAKTLTLANVEVREFRWSKGMADADGNPIIRVSGVYLADTGAEAGTWHRDIALDGAVTFTSLLGYTLGAAPGNVVKGPDGKAKAANDALGAGFGEYMKALAAKVRKDEGI